VVVDDVVIIMSTKVLWAETKEKYLRYNNNVDKYQKSMTNFVLPTNNEILLEHAHSLLKFIDAIHEITEQRKMKQQEKELEEKRKNAERKETNIDRFAYMDESQSEESEESTRDIDDMSSEEEDGLVINYVGLCQTTWTWYVDVKLRSESSSAISLYTSARFYMWIAFVRLYYLSVDTEIEKHKHYADNTVSKMDYFKQVSPHHYIEVSEEPIGTYSINELFTSLRLAYRSLYTFSYSRGMKDYIHAFFYRYAALISCEQPDDENIFDDPTYCNISTTTTSMTNNIPKNRIDDDNHDVLPIFGVVHHTQNNNNNNNNNINIKIGDDDDDDDNEILGNISKVDTLGGLVQAFQHMNIGVNSTCSINNRFVADGERLFYHQIYRLKLSSRLYRIASKNPLRPGFNKTFTREQFATECITSWLNFMLGLCDDTVLRTFIINDFKTKLIDIHMQHGEKEIFCDAYPGMSDDNRQILTEMRPNDLSYIEKTQLMTLRMIITAYHKELTAMTTADFKSLSYESECILLTINITKNWYQQKTVPDANEMASNMIYDELIEMDTLDSTIDTIVTHREEDDEKEVNKKNKKKKKKNNNNQRKIVTPTRKKIKCPLFIKLMRIYYTTNKDGAIYTSYSFIESYMIWTALCVKYQFIEKKHLHHSMSGIINKISRII
jgi:hypothetical protein